MFLGMLNEKERKNFLELAKVAMEVDGEVTESEQEMLENFRREVDLTDYEIKNTPIKDLKMFFDMSTKQSKKAVLFELAGMLYADQEVADSEAKWLKELGEGWGLRDSEIRKIIRWVMDFNDLLAEGFEYITRKERL